MKVDTFQCDGCGKQKQQANHWFRGYALAPDGVLIIPWDGQPASLPLRSDAGGEAHLCGAACVTEWLSKNLLN